MPVIRGQARGTVLADDRRKELLQKLRDELATESSSNGQSACDTPLIFEIPLERLDGSSDRMDVLVVWDAFKDIRSEDRTALILDAYQDQAAKIAQALGVTESEAWEQDLLPYSVRSTAPRGVLDSAEMIEVMLKEGGIKIGDHVELSFPTRAMAQSAMVRLYERLPKGAWGIAEAVPNR
jgi:hypothetical protein